MNSARLGGRVTPASRNRDIDDTEKQIVEEQISDEEQKALARLTHATAADQEKLTELKESYAGAVLRFMWTWFAAVVVLMLSYFVYQSGLGLEIPKEVIISIFTCTAVVVGLVGYILKGLFGTK